MSQITIDPNVRYMEGTRRVLDMETMLENTTKLISEIGVTRIANITDLERVGIPVFSAIIPPFEIYTIDRECKGRRIKSKNKGMRVVR